MVQARLPSRWSQHHVAPQDCVLENASRLWEWWAERTFEGQGWGPAQGLTGSPVLLMRTLDCEGGSPWRDLSGKTMASNYIIEVPPATGSLPVEGG